MGCIETDLRMKMMSEPTWKSNCTWLRRASTSGETSGLRTSGTSTMRSTKARNWKSTRSKSTLFQKRCVYSRRPSLYT